jgi:hypothetical protein
MSSIENGMRTRIAEFLPCALDKAIKSYHKFCEQLVVEGDPKLPKDFKDLHDACKVGLAHIELLIKLARMADLPHAGEHDENEHHVLQSLIEQAQSELRGVE